MEAVKTAVLQPPGLEIDEQILREYGHRVQPNGKLERRIIWNFLYHMAVRGFRAVGVWDGEEWTPTDDPKAAMELLFNLDEASLRFAVAQGFDRAKHEATRELPVHFDFFGARYNAYADNEHGVYLVFGNGVDLISDWNYFDDDRDGFNAAMEAFDSEEFA